MFERSESEAGPDSEKRVRQNWYWPALIAAGVLGLVVRFHHIAVVTSNYKGGGDPFYFYYWPGVQLARGHGFIDPLMSAYFNYPIESASHPPGFVLLVAGLYKMGFHTANDLRYVFAILGCVTVVLLGSLVGRIISPRAGVIAAAPGSARTSCCRRFMTAPRASDASGRCGRRARTDPERRV